MFFDYVEHDEKTIVETVMREIKWDKPSYCRLPWRFDCKLGFLLDYFNRVYGKYSMYDTDLSNMIRKGLINREEAMEFVTVDEESEWLKIKGILGDSGFTDKDIQKIEAVARRTPSFS